MSAPPGDLNHLRNGTPPAALDRLRELSRELEREDLPPDRVAEVAALLLRAELLLSTSPPYSPPYTPEEAAEGALVTDQCGVIIAANEAAAALLRCRRTFLVGQPLPFLLAESHWPTVYSTLSRLPRSQMVLRDWTVQLRARQPGESVILSLTMEVVPDAAGEPRLHWQVRQPLSNAVAERALEAERAFTDTLLDTAQQFALVVDSLGRIVRCNPFTKAATHLSDVDLLGKEWARALLPEADQPRGREAVRRAAGLGAYGRFSSGLAGSGGATLAVVWSVKAIRSKVPGPVFVLVLGHDVTELQQAQRRAVEAERLAVLGQMTAALSHEGRNLLQSTSACLERLSWRLEGRPEEMGLVRRAQTAQARLGRLFEDVRLYAAPLKLDLTFCSLQELWREVWAEVRAQWPDRPASLYEQALQSPLCLADGFRLQQVFRNVFENSFAACEGEVRVGVACHDADLDGRAAIRMSIRDNGPGLSPEQRARIFEPFFTTKPTGTGLGMAIARRIMDAHGGRITVGDASPGAEIILWLPRE